MQTLCRRSVRVSSRRLSRRRAAEEDLRSVSRWIASFPGVGLGTEPLSLPHHRLDHGVRSPQQLCYVVLLDQTLQDALPRFHQDTNTGEESCAGKGVTGLHTRKQQILDIYYLNCDNNISGCCFLVCRPCQEAKTLQQLWTD